MIFFFYNLAVPVTLFILKTISLFFTAVAELFAVRSAEKKTILGMKPVAGKKVVWLHGASVGELDQCRALAVEIKKCLPSSYIIQSVFSASVSAKNLQHPAFDFTFHLPFDTRNGYDHIFTIFKPAMIVLMAWDTWPNLVRAAKQANAKVYLASATINSSSGRMKGLAGRLTRKVFNQLDRIYPASDTLIQSFEKIVPPEKIGICGDTRFDAVLNKIKTGNPDKKFTEFIKNRKKHRQTIIYASTYSACDAVVLPAIPSMNDCSFWIFPHKINPERISEVRSSLEKNGIKYSVYSEIKKEHERVIIFDALGVLAHAYQYADSAYVGGALHNRVHNVIEPAYFGLPLFTGSRIFNSPEAQDLRQSETLFTVASSSDFIDSLKKVMADAARRKKISSFNKGYVLARTGYATKLCKEILK